MRETTGIKTKTRVDGADFLVLHRLRIRGLATEGLLAVATGLSEDEISACLRRLEERGLVRHLKGGSEGVLITARGTEAHATLLESLICSAAAGEDLYARFSALNQEFKAVCTAWQVGLDGEPNEHSSSSYDQAVLARFWVVHDAIATILTELAAIATHFAHYPERLDAAARRVSSGDHSALLRPLSDSYHDVWMELHHDLRLMLGKAT